ncbi:MAG: DNA helicase RecQ [Flavobacteriales bacterium]|nr:DNA helicase RecQ [Flavobacteriales bacterium]
METKDVSLESALKAHFGFDAFKGMQREVIVSLMEGKDTFAIMPTGGGKSLCYQLPALMKPGTAIIISPLIALMKNQVDSIRSYGAEDNIAHFLNSSLNKTEIAQVKEDVVTGKTKMLYLAPESLNKAENLEFLKSVTISFVAVDEAHCISEWGHDFRPEYRRIKEMIKGIDQTIAVMALTATATPKVQSDIQKNLGMTDAAVYKASFNRPNLFYEVRSKSDPVKQLIRFVKENEGKSGIIYCLSRKKVEEIASTLQVNGIKALPYHAGFDANTRSRHQDNFLMEDVDVIVATIAFGMGIDKPDVRFVIHYDMPKSLEGYYQETGRAGRDGGEGKCIAFYDYKDIEKLEKFMHNKPVAEQEVGRQLLEEIVSYAETAISRRKFLLNYFGEEWDEYNGDGANMDDNSVRPKEEIEFKDNMMTLFTMIDTVKQRFKSKHIVNVLCGSNTSEVSTYRHNNLPTFGIGKEVDPKLWMAAVRQALVKGYLYKDIENYGLLKISEKGRSFMENPPSSFVIYKDHDYSAEIEKGGEILANARSGGAVMDEQLMGLLKDLRKKISREKNVPPFVVFQDPSLQDMANQYPITIDELKNIQGVGNGKALKFGKPFIELITKYVDENSIDRPQDMVVKSVVNKSGGKVYIIQSIDRKIPLEDIAKAKGMQFDELLEELEHIVDSGTRVNIDYYINDVVDEDRLEEVYEYFMEAASPDIDDALEELGNDDYTSEELRLIRIKFMSEVAN